MVKGLTNTVVQMDSINFNSKPAPYGRVLGSSLAGTTAVTCTAAQLLAGTRFFVTPGGAGTFTLPGAAATAAYLLARHGRSPTLYETFEIIVVNDSAANVTVITAAAAGDETLKGDARISVAADSSMQLFYQFSDVTSGSETANVFLVGA